MTHKTTLDRDDIQQLTALFPASAHEFVRGFTYLTEDSITERLDTVDPEWSFEIVNLSTRSNQCIATGRLIVCGVARMNTGMAQINENAGEPEKSAVTDSLKRCARLFGIGRYILDMPSGVKDSQTLEKWLNARKGQKKAISVPTTQNTQPPAQTHSDAGKPVSEAISAIPADEMFNKPLSQNWQTFYAAIDGWFKNTSHRNKFVEALVNAKTINTQTDTVAQAVEIVKNAVEAVS